MALVEKLQRRIISIGLIPKLISKLTQLSLLCCVFGVGWLLMLLPSDGQFRRTYISENALLPSQAYSYFRESEWNILRGYRAQLDIFQHVSQIPDINAEVAKWLQDFGVKTSVYKDENYGETLYGIFHAPRGDGTEAMVIAAPWYNEDGKFNTGGTALAISLTRFFSRWPVWSKNIIIVLSKDPKASLRSWVTAYHTSLDLTGGSIESAIVLDYPGTNDRFDYVQIHYDGLNGETPNLDLVNTAVHITEHEGMKVSIHGIPFAELDDNDYNSRLKTMLLGIKDSVLAGIKKCHGNEAFSGWRIQAITLKAVGTNGPHDITTFGRIPEALTRSVNNLLEKFHQSFFFYLLLAPRYFVSIGTYLGTAVVVSVAFVLACLDQVLNNKFSGLPLLSVYNIWSALAFGIALMASFITSQFFFYLPQAELLLLVNVGLAALPLALRNRIKIQEPFSYRFKAFAYMYMAIVLTSLLVLNYSLAMVMGVLAFPMTRTTTILKSDIRLSLRNFVLVLISNPFIAIWAVVNLVEPSLSGTKVFYALIDAWQQLGCWTWYILCVGWYPSWLLVTYANIEANELPIENEVKKD
ncbi:GPI transamidase component GAA1 [Kluyveromyces marxianus]|nr:Glycosyl phosphatidyl inositol protein transamidase complex subunit [Kluyveromyces marxianus]KAG0675818.1 Glycosyl phosphatidyl inositol protein transamidase complex subunit [Kluyveromyces marxianus]